MTSQPSSPHAGSADPYAHVLRDGVEERRGIRWGVTVTLAVHAILLLGTFPEVASQELPRGTKVIACFPLPQRYKKPVPPITRPRSSRQVSVPNEQIDPIEVDIPPSMDVDPASDGLDAPPQPGTDQILYVGGKVARPERIVYVAPQARPWCIRGVVILQIIIGRGGQVTDVRVLKGLPMGLTEAAVDAVLRWRFSPATLEGEPVAVYYNVTVRFQWGRSS